MKKIKIIFAVILVVLLIYPGSFISYWFLRGIFDPSAALKIRTQMEKMSSEDLIKKMASIDPISLYPYTSMQILGDRKEKSAVPHLLKKLNHWDKYQRQTAIGALGEIGDKSSIPALMIIVEKREHIKTDEYKSALEALSKMQYDGAYPYIVELAEKNDISSVDMLANFDKPESIKLLEKMKNYYKSDSLRDQLYIDKIDDAMQKIKKQQ